jgi:hypothetical protein
MSQAEKVKSYLAVKKCTAIEEQEEKEEESEKSYLNSGLYDHSTCMFCWYI